MSLGIGLGLLFIAVSGIVYWACDQAVKSRRLLRDRGGASKAERLPWHFSLLNDRGLAARCGAGAGLVGGALGLLLEVPLLGVPAVALLSGAVVAASISFLRVRLRRKLETQFITALELMTSGLRSGQSLPQTIESSVQFLRPPMSAEFAFMGRQLRIGVTPRQVLDELAQRIPSEEVRQATMAMSIGISSGMNLAEVFVEIAESYRARQLLNRKIESLTAMGKAQAFVLALTPILFMAAGTVAFPEYVELLWTTRLGHLALLVVAVLQVITFVLVERLSRVEV